MPDYTAIWGSELDLDPGFRSAIAGGIEYLRAPFERNKLFVARVKADAVKRGAKEIVFKAKDGRIAGQIVVGQRA